MAVVRFRNDSGDPQDNLITDGIAEDLISAMARFGNLTVLARNTSFSFTSYDPSEWQRVRAQTGADYIVEGSVRRQDKTISVAVNLVDAATEEHLWGNRYLAEDIGIFPVQRQIVEEIIGRLVTRVGHVGLQRASRKDVANLAAYEAVLCGIQLMRDPAQSDLDGAATYFTAAIEKDPAYGLAYTYLALSRSIVGEFGPNNLDELERARELADKGAALSPDQATCRRIQSLVRIFLREHQAAEQYLKLALELNPLDAECIEQMGFLLTLRGRPIDALSWLARAIQLNPLHPHWYQYDRSLALYLSGDYRAAAEVLNLSTRLTPWIRTRLAACHAQLGEMDVAYRHIALARESHPDFSPADYAANGVPFENPSDAAHLADGILLALGQTPQS